MSVFQNQAESSQSAESNFTSNHTTAPSTEGSMGADESQSPLRASDAAAVSFAPGMKLREIERIVILETLKQKSFNRTHTAKALGIGIRTLQRKLKRYGASDWGLKGWKGNA